MEFPRSVEWIHRRRSPWCTASAEWVANFSAKKAQSCAQHPKEKNFEAKAERGKDFSHGLYCFYCTHIWLSSLCTGNLWRQFGRVIGRGERCCRLLLPCVSATTDIYLRPRPLLPRPLRDMFRKNHERASSLPGLPRSHTWTAASFFVRHILLS